jgi:DNA-binding SARP family transcriptional activator
MVYAICDAPPTRSGQMIRLQTLGSLSIEAGGAPPVGAAAQPRRSALLILLLRAGARGVSREKILALLWPDTPEERGRRTLAQAIYALRRDLGVGDAILGSGTLRINPELVTADVLEFEAAVAAGELERAVALYGGPFIDGFSLADAPEFERWVEEERRSLAAKCLNALKRLARSAVGPVEAIRGWQRVAAFDPVDTQATLEVMKALRASGDLAGALRHAQEYERRLAEEYELPPSPEVRALANELLATRTEPSLGGAIPGPGAEWRDGAGALSGPAGDGVVLASDGAVASRSPLPWRMALGMAATILVALAAALAWRSDRRNTTLPALVIGQITDLTADTGLALGGSIRELLATDLARVSGVAVVSSARVYDLILAGGNLDDTTRAGYLRAARRAGAAHLFDGSIFALDSGRYRLDLRRVDPGTGVITAERSAIGNDLYAMTDTLALWVASGLGTGVSTFAPITTSLEAFRWYREGLQAYVQDRRREARGHFVRALELDSLLVMAEYYRALSTEQPTATVAALNRAYRLSDRLSERDRLIVTATWLLRNLPAQALAVAESLATRYPAEVEGHLAKGQALLQRGEVAAAIPPLRHALEMSIDGASTVGVEGREADITSALITAYATIDSVPAMLREARRWSARQPTSIRATVLSAWALRLAGRPVEAVEIYRASDALRRSELAWRTVFNGHVVDALQADGNYAAADSYFVEFDTIVRGAEDEVKERATGHLWRAIVLRDRGRFAEARTIMRTLRTRWHLPDNATEAMCEARFLLLTGEFARSHALFDSVYQTIPVWHGPISAEVARRAESVHLMYAAEPAAHAGDVAMLRRLRDSIQVRVPAVPAPQELAPLRHVEGLLYQLEGRLPQAERAFRAAMIAPVTGYTWTNLDLARVLIEEGRPRDAVAPLRAALRHQVFAVAVADAYAPRPTIQAHLAYAWERAGQADSARVARERFDQLWAQADSGVRVFPDPAVPIRSRTSVGP